MPILMNRDRISTTAYFASFVALGMVMAALGPTLLRLAGQTGVQLGTISVLFTTQSLGYLTGSFTSGRLYDRIPGHFVMAAGLVLAAIALALAPLISLLWALAATFLFLGVAGGAIDVGGNTLIIWAHRRDVDPYMAGLHFFFGVGSFITPIIVAQVVSVTGKIAPAFWILALLLLPLVFWFLRLQSPERPAPVPDESRGDDTTAAPERLIRQQVIVVLVAMLLFLHTGAELAFGGWIFTYAVKLEISGEAAAAYLTSAFWGALTFGRLLSIPLAAQVRPRWMLLGSLVGCLISVSLFLTFPLSQTATWLGAIGLGLSMAPFFPSTLSWAGRHVEVTGKVTGWFLVGASLGSMLLPWLIGQAFESLGPLSTMVIIALDIIVAFVVFVALMLYSNTRLEFRRVLLYNRDKR